MKILLKCIILIILSIIGITVKAELTNSIFELRHIDYSEGLSSERVFSIVEDKYSVMWIATKVGIDRFNGQAVNNNLKVPH